MMPQYDCMVLPRRNLSSSSRMRVMNHNWSATKQRLHPQSVTENEISHHSVLSGDRIRQYGTSSLGLATRTQISVCKSPFPSAGTTVSLFHAATVQQRPHNKADLNMRLVSGYASLMYLSCILIYYFDSSP